MTHHEHASPGALRRSGASRPDERGRDPLTRVLELQRLAGNRVTRAVLAREKEKAPPANKQPASKPATPPYFRLLIVDDGKTGLDKVTLDTALATVHEELDKVTSQSSNDVVKAGLGIEVVSEVRRAQPRDLGKKTFVAFLIHDADAAHWVDVVGEHLDLDARERKKNEAEVKAQLAAEGGATMTQLADRRGLEQSISLVSTLGAKAEEKKQGAGPKSAGRLLGEVIVHELGHSLGHHEHEKAGIMTATRVLGSGAYAADHLSKASREIIQKRLEWIAETYPPRTP